MRFGDPLEERTNTVHTCGYIDGSAAVARRRCSAQGPRRQTRSRPLRDLYCLARSLATPSRLKICSTMALLRGMGAGLLKTLVQCGYPISSLSPRGPTTERNDPDLRVSARLRCRTVLLISRPCLAGLTTAGGELHTFGDGRAIPSVTWLSVTGAGGCLGRGHPARLLQSCRRRWGVMQ